MTGKKTTGKKTAGPSESTRLTLEVKRALAAVVEKFPDVWDLTHINYKNRDAREASWTKIADEMNLSGRNFINIYVSTWIYLSLFFNNFKS